jgi:hypothetical protein
METAAVAAAEPIFPKPSTTTNTAKESLDRVFLSPIAGRALDLDAGLKQGFRPSAALRSATPAPAGTRKRKGEATTKFAPCLDPIQQRLGDRVVALFARAGGRVDASRSETSA